MNKSNSIMEKMQEYQAPKCDVMELQNEGAILSASISDIKGDDLGDWGSVDTSTNINSLF